MDVVLDARRYSKGGVSFETVPPHELRGAARRLPRQSLHARSHNAGVDSENAPVLSHKTAHIPDVPSVNDIVVLENVQPEFLPSVHAFPTWFGHRSHHTSIRLFFVARRPFSDATAVISFGCMSHCCSHCDALHWLTERVHGRSNAPEFGQCWSSGPMPTLAASRWPAVVSHAVVCSR